MGLRKYIENLVIKDVEADKTLTVNGFRSDRQAELVGYINTSTVSSFSETVGSFEQGNKPQIIVDVINYQDDESGANNDLTLSLAGSDNYDSALEDEQLNSTYVTGQNEFILVRPTASDNFDQHTGLWNVKIGNSSRPTIFGRGSIGNNSNGSHLAKGTASVSVDSTFGLTFEASGGGDGVSLECAVYKRNPPEDVV